VARERELPSGEGSRPTIGDGLATGGLNRDDATAAPAAVAQLLSRLAEDAAVVVIVDDLQDASPATVDALGAMLNRLVGPVLVLLLGRPELVRSAGTLTRLADAEVHPIAPLRGAEMARLLAAYLAGGRLPDRTPTAFWPLRKATRSICPSSSRY
jgi:hypothetical protein